jgi:hypothetical protein
VLRGDTLLMARSLTAGPHLAHEVRRNLIVHAGQAAAQPVRALYLAGAGSGELREKLGDLTDLPVHTFDPFAGAESLNLPAGNRGAFAGAAGLLHARARAGGLPINFAAVRQIKPPKNPQNRLVAYAAAALVLLVAAVVGGSKVVQARGEHELETLNGDTMLLDEDLAQLRDETRRLKSMEDWDSLPWVDELYELAAVIKDVNALRVSHWNSEPIPRTSGSPYIAKVTLRGTVNDARGGRGPVTQLVTALGLKGGHYRVQAPKMTGNQFLLEVLVERRAPTEYKGKLPAAPKAAPPPDEEGDDEGGLPGLAPPGRGGFPGRGVPGMGGPNRGGRPGRGRGQ